MRNISLIGLLTLLPFLAYSQKNITVGIDTSFTAQVQSMIADAVNGLPSASIYSGSGTIPDFTSAKTALNAGFEFADDNLSIRGDLFLTDATTESVHTVLGLSSTNKVIEYTPQDTVNLSIQAVMPQMSIAGGREYLTGIYTDVSPLSVIAGDTTQLLLNGTANRDFLPPGYDSIYNRTTQRMLPQIVGEGWSIRVNFKGESNNQDGYFYVALDIGDGTTPIYITERVKTFPKGTGVSHPFSQTDATFNLETFVANGGRIMIIGGVGTTTLYDVNVIFERVNAPHGQVYVGDTPGYWTVPDDLVGGSIIGVQYAFRTAHSGGTIDMQLSDGTVGFAGTTIADGDRVQSLDLSGTPVSLTSERLIQPVAVSSTATTLPKGLIVNLTIVK